MDELGTPKTLGYSWQTTWGAPKTTAAPTGTGATKVVVTADHATLLTDLNDVSFIKAAISDASGAVVSSTTPVTFAITGPGTIIAVDSASMTQETFRGNVRNAYAGFGLRDRSGDRHRHHHGDRLGVGPDRAAAPPSRPPPARSFPAPAPVTERHREASNTTWS